MKKILSTVLAIVLVCVCFASCGNSEEKLVKEKICGAWVRGDVDFFGDEYMSSYIFSGDNTYQYIFDSESRFSEEKGTYKIDTERGYIICTDEDGNEQELEYELNDDSISISDCDSNEYIFVK